MDRQASTSALVEVNRARIRALVAGDWETLERYVAPDMRYISGTGTVQAKDEVFRRFRDGRLSLLRQEADEESVCMLGDVAIVVYRADTVTLDEGVRIEGVTRSSSTYHHRDGRWQLVLQHNTFIA